MKYEKKKLKKKHKRPWSYDEPSLALQQIDNTRLNNMVRNGYSVELAQSILFKELVEKKSLESNR